MATRKRSVETLPDWVRRHEHPERSARVRVRMPVEIEQGRKMVDGKVVDVSRDGLRIRAAEPIAVGLARLRCNGDWHLAEIKWVEGLEFGADINQRANLPKA